MIDKILIVLISLIMGAPVAVAYDLIKGAF